MGWSVRHNVPCSSGEPVARAYTQKRTRSGRHAPESSHVLADLESAQIRVDAAVDRVVAEESRLPAVHNDVIEE